MRRSRNFTESERQKIMAKSYCDDVTVLSISKQYGISRSTLFKWRRKYESASNQARTEIESSNSDILEKERFLEVKLEEGRLHDNTSYDISSRKFHQKLSLNFGEVSVSLDGYINASSLVKIIKILNEELC